jgi:hypothetical protein
VYPWKLGQKFWKKNFVNCLHLWFQDLVILSPRVSAFFASSFFVLWQCQLPLTFLTLYDKEIASSCPSMFLFSHPEIISWLYKWTIKYHSFPLELIILTHTLFLWKRGSVDGVFTMLQMEVTGVLSGRSKARTRDFKCLIQDSPKAVLSSSYTKQNDSCLPNSWHYWECACCVTGSMRNTLHAFAIKWNRHYFYLHFTDKNSETLEKLGSHTVTKPNLLTLEPIVSTAQ